MVSDRNRRVARPGASGRQTGTVGASYRDHQEDRPELSQRQTGAIETSDRGLRDVRHGAVETFGGLARKWSTHRGGRTLVGANGERAGVGPCLLEGSPAPEPYFP